ncbi:hypothetical protein QBZ16_000922 [Prototheca wickerhamii]|uniref:Aminopeptidase N n=1 Tax=Prototheca wickerhamii TaxID=3111 RepID=A0AAD9MH76_PROWI|nr:hypothetical protein QBZ16_000922 [Prototheca wickerhamii]
MTATPEKPVEKFRKDYKPPPYLIPNVDLTFDLHEESTTVVARLRLSPNHGASEPVALVLDGHEDIKLESIKVDGKELDAAGYAVAPTSLTLHAATTRPWRVLYKSGGMFCTQCEAEGFRHITYFLDRPDVMAKYTTRIEADRATYPVLLSNGNLVASGDAPGAPGRHFTVWEDPFAKPCYLFALVAGDLALREDSFRTASGRDVALRFYTDVHNADRTRHAIDSLKRAMAWDEARYGLEYDLDLFNVVAVDDFNMGAMENKSLNLFNSRLVLATPASATDVDFSRIEGVVGHEYFHNWTGNRVTCRDWFQLTLKEGLTVYRDQEFSADLNSGPVKRIEDAHAIRPDSYIKMDNFYTTTVYEKGAEVVRLYEALLGRDGFRAGLDLYFKRHDGQAVTCDDFRAAMADANGEDLSGLEPWYAQAGTPEVHVSVEYDAIKKTCTLRATQRVPATRGQPAEGKRPALVPLRLGLLAASSGAALPLHLRAADGAPAQVLDASPAPTEEVLRLDRAEQAWVFDRVPERPVLSILRGFSAPVRLTVEGQTREDLLLLLAHDTDAFNRWEAGQKLLERQILDLFGREEGGDDKEEGGAAKVARAGDARGRRAAARESSSDTMQSLIDGLRAVLTDPALDGAFKAYALSLPDLAELAAAAGPGSDPVALHAAREAVADALARGLRAELEAAVAANDAAEGEAYSYDAASCAKRALKNAALGLLARLDTGEEEDGSPSPLATAASLAARQASATNMTDEIAALGALCRRAGPARDAALAAFYEKWRQEPLVLLKWIAVQAGSNVPGNVAAVRTLIEHPAVKLSNPNTCYSLFLAFARSPVNFHAADGSGYDFMAESVLRLDKINRQVAARAARAFNNWHDVDAGRQELMLAALRRIAAEPGLSENVYEIVSKALPQA